MEKTQLDALKALEVIKNNKENKYGESNFKNYTPCYEFSNENLNEYYNESIGQNILTVCGSGDQVLCSILYGAKQIDCFDSNPLTYYTMMLKLYLIKNTDYETFLEFYNLKETKKEKIEIYKNIRQYIKENIRLFWDEIFKNEKNIDNIYKKNNEKKENLFIGIPYLKKENYIKLKNNIDNCNISFTTCDIFEIPNIFKNKYDFINFSNIFNYIDGIEETLKFCKLILSIKQNNTKENSLILINYSWNKMHSEESVEMASTIMEAYQIEPKQKNIKAPDDEGTNSILYYKTKN
jgi:hypothetical protein